MRNESEPLSPVPWRIQNLRLILFTHESPAFEPSRGWWRGLAGNDPDHSVERRAKLEREDSGTHDGSILELQVDLLRAQWTVGPLPTQEGLEEAVAPHLGEPAPRIESFVEFLKPWLAADPVPVKRLALVGSALIPERDHAAAYNTLGAYLPAVTIDPDSSDFLYRINRRRQSRVLGTQVNRLTTWAAFKLFVALGVTGPTEPTQTARIEKASYGCLVDFDINTPAERTTPIPAPTCADLLAEFGAFALDLLTGGDRP